MQKWCTFLSVFHLLAISLTTLVAAFVIESILGSGSACMVIAMVALFSSLLARRFWLTLASLTTIAAGAFFIVYELIFYGFGGPQKAALPLCVLFLTVQACSIFCTLADLNQRQRSSHVRAPPNQISLKQLLIASTIFPLSFGIMENFPLSGISNISDWNVAYHYKWLVSISLALFFLTVCGFLSIWMTSRRLKVLKSEQPNEISKQKR